MNNSPASRSLSHLSPRILPLGLLLASLQPIHADTSLWSAGTGDWNDNGSWTQGTPMAGDTFFISNGGTVTLTTGTTGAANLGILGGGTLGSTNTFTLSGTGSLALTDEFRIGDAGIGIFNLSGGTLSNTVGNIGRQGGSTGTANITGGTWTNTASLYVGNAGTGTLTLSAGTITAPFVRVADGAGSTGTLDLGGTLTTGQVSKGAGTGSFNFYAGTLKLTGDQASLFSGFSTVTLNSGSDTIDTQGFAVTTGAVLNGAHGNLLKLGSGTLTLTAANTYVGSTTINAGTLELKGLSASVAGNIALGNGATLKVSDGAQLGKAIQPGYDSGTTGTLTVTGIHAGGTASTWNAPSFDVGYGGTGILNVGDGGRVNGDEVTVGATSGAHGTINVQGVHANGTASTLNLTTNIHVGYGGTGALNVENGGAVILTQNSSVINIGTVTGGSGAITVTGVHTLGTASSLSVLGSTIVGNGGTGTLTVADGAIATLKGVIMAGNNGQGTLNLNSGGTLVTRKITELTDTLGGQINLNGGILKAAATSTDFLSGFETGDITLGTSGGTFHTNGYNITITPGLVDASASTGGLTKTGMGTLTLSGANSYSGGTTVSQGTLTLTGANTNGYYLTNIFNGTLEVTGTGASYGQANARIYVGLNSGDSGAMNISSGAQVTSITVNPGYNADTTGTVTVTGTGTKLSVYSVYAGYSGTGSFTVSNGASVEGPGNFVNEIAHNAGSTGTVTVTGAGSNWTGLGNLSVGYSGNGTVTVSDGGLISGQYIYLGRNTGSIGNATVTGAGSTLNATIYLQAGFQSNTKGTLTIENDGQVSTPYVVMGGNTASEGTVNVNSGGILATGFFSEGLGTGKININGGIIKATTTGTDFFYQFETGDITLGNSGGTFNTNGYHTVITQGLVGAGGLNKTGAGTLKLTAASTYAGETTITQGTLQLGAANAVPSASAVHLSGGTFDIAGLSPIAFTAPLTVDGVGSTLDFGLAHIGGVTVQFGDSSGVTWTSSLTLLDFTVGTDALGFGSSTSGLTVDQLAYISLAGYTAIGLDTNGFVEFETAAVPEPTLALVMPFGIALLAYGFWRRRQVEA